LQSYSGGIISIQYATGTVENKISNRLAVFENLAENVDTEASDRTLTLQSRSVFIIHYTLKQNIAWADKECSTLICKNR
jgi:hypothetical protein